ncbi:helix-turn-helix domain-containing protein [Clostridium baratii]|uniref:helix-turn-helix domain-containing protein n=1 Tax=Clostridium baratii TaxID=1561 RepID=UPI00374E7CDF
MDFYKVLENLMKTRNLSIPEISRATGLSDSTLRSIISRKTKNISLEVAFKLSQGLNVSLEELNGEKEISTNIDKAIELSIEEKNHLEDLRKLNDMGKKKVITYTKDLIEMPKYIKEAESDYLAPIAAHDDNLTDEEKAVMDQKINEYLNKHK